MNGKLLLALGVSIAINVGADAEGYAAQRSITADQDARNDGVFVFADKRSVALEDAPFSVIKLDGDDLIDRQIFTQSRLFNQFPLASLDNSYSAGASYAACGGLTTLNNATPPCAIVVNGVQLRGQRELNFPLFDIESVEFASGPIGVHYQSALGGVFTINTTKPDGDRGANGLIRFGNGASFYTQGSAQTPIAENLNFLISGFFRSDDGRIENEFTGLNVDFVNHDWSVRGRLVYTPTDNIEIDLIGHYGEFELGAGYYALNRNNNINEYPAPSANRFGLTDGGSYGVSATVTWDLGFHELRSVSAWNENRDGLEGDLDFGNPENLPEGAFNDNRQTVQQFSYDSTSYYQHIQLTRLNGDDNNLGYSLSAAAGDTEARFPGGLIVDDFGPRSLLFGDPTSSEQFLSVDTLFESRFFAIAFQADYDLTDRINISAAVRHERDRKRQTDFLLPGAPQQSETFASTPTFVSLAYDAGPFLAYFKVSDAERPGGFNFPGQPSYDAERLRRYEIGAKAPLLDNRAFASIAAYCGPVKRFQAFTLVGAAQRIINIENVDLCGVEGTLDYAPADWIDLYANFGFLDAEVTESLELPEIVGNRPPNFLRYTFNAGGALRRPLGQGLEGAFTFDVRNNGKRTWDLRNNFVQRGRVFANAQLGLERGGFGVSVFVHNLLNTRSHAEVLAPPDGGRPFSSAYPTPLREFGVQFKGSL